MPTMPSFFPVMRRPSIQVGDQPAQSPSVALAAPSTMRRETATIRPMVMSAVSSVRTPGVLVTVIPRRSAEVTSILSTPLPKLAMSFNCSPDLAMRWASMRSVTVGTSTSATRIASASSAALIGLSVGLKRASNNSRMRASTGSGNLRVTMTSGVVLPMRIPFLEHSPGHPGVLRFIQFAVARRVGPLFASRPTPAFTGH